jgi:hypothetical protein
LPSTEDFDRVGVVRYLVGQVAGQELAQFLGNGRRGESGEDRADRAIEVEQ